MIILLREATDNDLELILAWRNNPLIWQGLYTQSRENRPLTWEEHYKFWHSPYRATWKQFIIQINDGQWTRSVGYVQFGQLDHWRPEIACVIGEVSLWGQGIGKEATLLALDWLGNQDWHGKKYEKIHTSVLKSNERAVRLFESVGFKRIGEAREDEWEYEMWLKDRIVS